MKRFFSLPVSFCCSLLCSLLIAACSTSDGNTDTLPYPGQGHLLDMQVSVGQSASGQPDDPAETTIHSVYVYAYDDLYPSALPDFYADPLVNQGAGVQHKYSFKMKIYDEGYKRFYVFVNPPAYIREQLVYNNTEAKLKSLNLYLNEPLTDIRRLPQSIDGIPESQANRATGFPMSNYFEAYARFPMTNSPHISLFASSSGTEVIHSIPLFRALGNIRITAWRKGYDRPDHPEAVAIQKIELFRFGGKGTALPTWQESVDYWIEDPQTASAVWNPYLALDLKQMAVHEDQLITDPFSLLRQPVEIPYEYNSPDRAYPVHSCYLVQNSYGDRANADDPEEGLHDAIGDRITHMKVYLNDGRISEMELPYLRRNDRLNIRLAISKYNMDVTFEKWNTSDVNPEWGEQIVSSSNEH